MKKRPRGTLHVIAQSHIDLAWLWQFDPETIHGCCKPTFSLATTNLDKYPEYRFSQSQVPLYTATKKAFPELFAKISAAVARGAWEIVGGMFVEFDGGEPGGEALVRQCVVGKRYFQATFGVDVTTGWQEDAWTHPWQLPQILRKCGMDSYMFKRGSKGENLFWWQAPDGSRVLAYKPYHKGHKGPSREWLRFFDEMRERYGIEDVMIRIGKGDHGGGPFTKDIESINKFKESVAPELEVKFNTFADYVKTLVDKEQQSAQKFPVLDSELGFELSGDLTNCCEIKQNNRASEILLLRAEIFASMASVILQRPYPREILDEAWEKILFNQFHDIIGGSGIPPVCEDAHRDYRQAHSEGFKILAEALGALSITINTQEISFADSIPPDNPVIVIFNPLSWDRAKVVEIPLLAGHNINLKDLSIYDARGTPVHFQSIQESGQDRIIFTARCPSMGYTSYYLGHQVDCARGFPTAAEGYRLENAFFLIQLDPATGNIARLFDKVNGREVLNDSGKGNLLVALKDEGDSEGRFKKHSDTDIQPPTKGQEIANNHSIEIMERGPVRATIRVTKRFQRSTFRQDITVYAQVPQVDVDLEMDWHEEEYMVKVVFPYAFHDNDVEVTSDSAYGAIRRPADGLEYACQKWVDLYSPRENYGVALLNYARYGYDALGNTLRLSLLRSPTIPALNTDEGIHRMTYALYPHAGTWKDAKVMQKGYELNYPVSVINDRYHDGILPKSLSFLGAKPANVIVEVVKMALDSKDVIIRAYETEGTACDAELTFPWPIASACETDLLEKAIKPLETEKTEENKIYAHFGVCEIKTLKVTVKVTGP